MKTNQTFRFFKQIALLQVMFMISMAVPAVSFTQVDTSDPLVYVRDLITDNEIMLVTAVQYPDINYGEGLLEYLDYDGTNTLTTDFLTGLYGKTNGYQPGDQNLPSPANTGGYFGPGTIDVANGYLYQSQDPSATRKQSIISVWSGENAAGTAYPVMSIRAELEMDTCGQVLFEQSPGIFPPDQALASIEVPQVRVATGNIMNDDGQDAFLADDEIILAYTAANGHIYLYLYEPSYFCWNQQLNGDHLVPHAIEIDFIQGPQFHSTLSFSHVMDIECGDFDGDNYDEIALVLVKPDQSVYVHVYEYNEQNQALQEKYQQKIIDPNIELCTSDCINTLEELREQVKIITGDFYPDFLGEEIVIGAFFAAAFNEGSMNIIPLRENQSGNGFIFDICSGCNTSCGSYNCTESNVLFYRESGLGSPDGMDRFDLAGGDLEGFNNQFDQEVVVAFNDKITVLSTHVDAGSMRLMKTKSFTADSDQNDPSINKAGFFTQSFVDIGNVHSIDPNDTTTVNLNDFAAEIVVVTNKVLFDPPGYPLGSMEQSFNIQVFQFPEEGDSVNLTANPVLVASRNNHYVDQETPKIRPYAMILSDRDGGGISFGKPIRRDIDNVITPVVIINAPPTHFDVFDDDTLDINNIYDVGNEPKDISARTDRTIYRETSGSTTTFSTQINSDWAESQSIKAGFEGYGVSVGGTLSRTYGEKFEKVSSNTREISFEMETSSLLSDRVIGYEVDYGVYEYPVYFNGNTKDTISYVVVVIPHYPENTIAKDQAALDNDFQYNHQHGNLFSYAESSDDLRLIDASESYNLGSISIDNNSDPASRKVTFSTATSTSMSSEKSNQHSFEANVGFAFKGLSIGGSVSGMYSASELNTRSTTVSNTKEMEAYFERVEQGLLSFEYTVTPYLLWDINGAIVIDYTVDINNQSGDLFYNRYNATDPAFLLPQIHDQEKGNIIVPYEARRYRSKEVKHYPLALPGRKTTLFARVHNYGMQSTSSNIPVCFYYNTEADENLQRIACDTIVNGLVGRENDFGNAVAQVDWTIPLALTQTNKPKIIAIIDPDNNIPNEVHDYPNANGISNNIAWNCLYGTDCGDILDASKLVLDQCSGLQSILTLDQSSIVTGNYYATNKIVLTGTILNGSQILVKAPNGAEIMPSFDIHAGGSLEVVIGNCNE